MAAKAQAMIGGEGRFPDYLARAALTAAGVPDLLKRLDEAENARETDWPAWRRILELHQPSFHLMARSCLECSWMFTDCRTLEAVPVWARERWEKEQGS